MLLAPFYKWEYEVQAQKRTDQDHDPACSSEVSTWLLEP